MEIKKKSFIKKKKNKEIAYPLLGVLSLRQDTNKYASRFSKKPRLNIFQMRVVRSRPQMYCTINSWQESNPLRPALSETRRPSTPLYSSFFSPFLFEINSNPMSFRRASNSECFRSIHKFTGFAFKRIVHVCAHDKTRCENKTRDGLRKWLSNFRFHSDTSVPFTPLETLKFHSKKTQPAIIIVFILRDCRAGYNMQLIIKKITACVSQRVTVCTYSYLATDKS